MTASDAPPDNAGVRFPPPLWYVAIVGGGFVVQHFRPLPIVAPEVRYGATLAGLGIMVVAVLLSAGAVRAFRAAGTSPYPFKPSTALVVRGPYRRTRNPMYLALTLMSAGFALLFNALWPLLLLPLAVLAIHIFVIRREERYLALKFGDDYRRYVARVRRWI